MAPPPQPHRSAREPRHAIPGGCLAQAALAGLAALPDAAAAHVRWFTSLPESLPTPHGPTALLRSPVFLALLALTLVVMALVQAVELHVQHRQHLVARLAERAQPPTTRVAALLVRIGIALYLAGLALVFRAAPVTLAPELHAGAAWIPPLQLLLAACFLSRRTVLAGCAGLLALLADSVRRFGWVHMVDYHFFLGVCALLVLDSRGTPAWSRAGLAIFRATVATSFMWVGIEKWLHPEWTQDVLERQLPALLMGQSPQFVATAAGFVEVALAFLVLLGSVSAQLAAAVLLLLISTAIPLAGLVDAVGHLPMIFFLLVLAGTGNRIAAIVGGMQPASAVSAPCRFLIVVGGVTGLYFLAHQFGTGGVDVPAGGWPQVRLALCWSVVLGAWALHLLRASQRSGAAGAA